MHMTITRQAMDSSATLSRLVIDDHEFWGIEKPWRNNRSMVSCIPIGHYALVPYKSPRYGRTWAFVGGSVSAKKSRSAQRFACRIPKGIFGKDVKGCVAIGSAPGKGKQLAVTSSTLAFDRLTDMMEGAPYPTGEIDGV